jgi:ribosome biogenesis protein Tsr3
VQNDPEIMKLSDLRSFSRLVYLAEAKEQAELPETAFTYNHACLKFNSGLLSKYPVASKSTAQFAST